MNTRRKVVANVLDLYKIPSKEELRHRNEFFGLWRRSDDQTTAWLKRVQNCIRHCKFPTNTSEHLLLDRFICGLNAKELKSIQKSKKFWTPKQLMDHFSKESNDIAYIKATLTSIQGDHQIENISLAVVKSEPTEEQCVQKDPLNELAEDADSINDEEPKKSNKNEICTVAEHTEIPAVITDPTIAKIEEIEEECLLTDPLNDSKQGTATKSTSDEIEDNLMEAPEEREIASSDDEEFNFQQALNEEIDHELLNSGMQFECEDYKFSVDVSSTVATAANAINGVDIAADVSASTNDTTTIGKPIDDVDENLSIEEAPNKSDRQKEHCSDGNKASNGIDSVTSCASDTTDDDDEKSSESSTDNERNRNDHIKDFLDAIHGHGCKECGKRFETFDRLRSHARSHTDERPYVCDECGVSYKHPNALSRHKKSVHLGLRPHMCQICDKRFITKDSLRDHLSTHSTVKLFVCDQCGKGFNQMSNFRIHKDRVHHQKLIPSHACPICDKRFYIAATLERHSITHTGDRTHFSCDQCDKKFTQSTALRKHKNAIHKGERYVCDECGVSYKHPNTLANHKTAVHLGLRPHVCQICDKTFTMKVYLNEHLSTHSTVKSFVCDACGKGFRRSTMLRSHKNRVHHQKMPSHACQKCDKRFFIAAALKSHSLTHTGERPHSCDHCDKKFAQAAALKLHKNSVHQGLRPHACPHCDKQFKQPHHLSQHLTIHTGEKAYSCDQCDKSFALGHHLSSHKKSVHQLKA